MFVKKNKSALLWIAEKQTLRLPVVQKEWDSSRNFYNWVSKIRKIGYTFPKSEAKSNATPVVQEVVKVDLVPVQEPSHVVEQNVSLPVAQSVPSDIAELLIGNITFRFFNGVEEQLI